MAKSTGASTNKGTNKANSNKSKGKKAKANEPETELVQPAASESDTATPEQPEKEIKGAGESDAQTDENAGNSGEENKVDDLYVVIPYLKSAAAGDELKYALRSLAASFPDAKVVVVGDKEDWFTEGITHLQHVPENDNPQIDVAQKLLLVLASGVIKGEQFILSNDDIFFLGQTWLEDISTLKAFGELNKNVGKAGGKYNQNAENTRKALAKEKLPAHRYGTHTPVLIWKRHLAEVLEKYNTAEKGHLVTSLYFNSLCPNARPIQVNGGAHDPILVSVYRAGVAKEILEDALAKRKFLNVNDAGWKSVEPYMAKMYPDKSKWEA